MKKHLFTLASLLLAVANAQAAAPTAELKVKGNIEIPSCTISAPNNGVYSLGKLSPSLVFEDKGIFLPTMVKTWTVTCDTPTYLSMTMVDNRAATASATTTAAVTFFGLGNINGTGKIGYYSGTITNGFVDGVSTAMYTADMGSSRLSTSPRGSGFEIYVVRRFGWSDTNGVAIAGRVFSTDISITPLLARKEKMNGPVTDSAKIDGSMTINFSFAI